MQQTHASTRVLQTCGSHFSFLDVSETDFFRFLDVFVTTAPAKPGRSRNVLRIRGTVERFCDASPFPFASPLARAPLPSLPGHTTKRAPWTAATKHVSFRGDDAHDATTRTRGHARCPRRASRNKAHPPRTTHVSLRGTHGVHVSHVSVLPRACHGRRAGYLRARPFKLPRQARARGWFEDGHPANGRRRRRRGRRVPQSSRGRRGALVEQTNVLCVFPFPNQAARRLRTLFFVRYLNVRTQLPT